MQVCMTAVRGALVADRRSETRRVACRGDGDDSQRAPADRHGPHKSTRKLLLGLAPAEPAPPPPLTSIIAFRHLIQRSVRPAAHPLRRSDAKT